MNIERENHTATALPDGRILIVGGNTNSGVTDTAEYFDPWHEDFRPLSTTLSVERQHHRAILVGNRTFTTTDDALLIVGGIDDLDFTLDSADLFDPVLDEFVPINDRLYDGVAYHSVVTNPDYSHYDASIMGGFEDFDPIDILDSDPTSQVEFFSYDYSGSSPDGYFVSAVSMDRSRAWHTTTLVNRGHGPRIVIGGVDFTGSGRANGEFY